MADQIIIELIGDPSGLKPAEDALKKLSKISEENISAFKKANEAFIKYKASAADKQVDIAKQSAAKEIEIAKQVSDAIFANAQQRRDNELKATGDHLNAQKNAELLNTTLTASQRNAIEKKYKAEEAQAKLQAWKADQKAKEEQAIINGLLAFTTALAQQGYPAGLVTGLLALAQAGVQAGIIASKTPPKFATGTPGSMVTPAGMKWVGEKGPELIYTPGGEKIMTNPDSMALLEKYRIPNISGNVSQLLEGTGVTLPGSDIDYDRLGRVIAKNIPSAVNNVVTIDKNGFKVYTEKGGNRTEFLNNTTKF